MPSVSEQFGRYRRQLLDVNIASSKRKIEQKTIVRGNGNHLSMLHERFANESNEAQGLNVANTVLRDGADLLGTPVRWIKDMQQHWLAYMVCASVILVCVLAGYCIVRSCWSRRSNSPSKLPDLATILALKSMAAPSSITKPVTEA